MKLVLDRRTLLRGAGVAMALPWLECMLAPRASGDRGARSSPLRVAWVYAPNGKRMDLWTPASEGALATLPPTLEPLVPHREHVLVLSGLAHDKARANGDGAGDHARAAAAFLTGAQPFKTDGANIHAGVSADQVAAQAIGNRTRLRSLEIGCEGGALSGQCDSGYSCAYSSTIAWQTAHTPLPKETSPKLVFERLFLDGEDLTPEQRAARAATRKSVLDLARDDAKRLAGRLGANDLRKLDEYESSVRELERRVGEVEHDRVADVAPSERPTAKPKDHAEHAKLMCDLLVLAFRTDTTRIATFMLANEGSNRSYAFLGAPEGHHDLSHHGGEAQKLEKLAKIDRFHVEQLAYLLERMKAIDEGDGTLLDHAAIAYGSGIRDGNRHDHDDAPMLVCGGANGTLRGGRHLRVAKETPAANLHVALLRRLGVDVARLGDSTGALDGLAG